MVDSGEFEIRSYEWSPDSRYHAYEIPVTNQFSQVRVWDAKAEQKEEKVEPIRIDFDGLAGRIVQFPVQPGNYSGLRAIPGKLHFVGTHNRGMRGTKSTIDRLPAALLATVLCLLSASPARPQSHETPALVVRLPEQLRTFPEALPAERNSPGFKLRGIKGWMWRPHQYLAEVPVLARYNMNFLMNCYLSMFDIEHHAFGDPDCNRWWEPLPDGKKRDYEEVVRSCVGQGINFCFCMNPNLTARRFANAENQQDVADLWQHYQWMQDLGVQWFSICLDDIRQGTDPRMQARLVNEILGRLRIRDRQARMIFCPTFYSGDGTSRDAERYLRALAADLDSTVYVFWTGEATVTTRITRKAAERYRAVVGHRLVLWDNYPVNDSHPTMNLGPITGRDPDLGEVVDGYMSNSHCPQNEINEIPMLTCADYAYNPWQYDPARSIGQAILHMAEKQPERAVLAALVEAYPGNLLFNTWYNYNPVRACFSRLDSLNDGGVQVRAYMARMQDFLQQFKRTFPERFLDARKSLSDDLSWMTTEGAKRGRR
jgi:hypothetical protein